MGHRRAALALAAGAVHRAKGGMAMQGVVGVSVETLLAVARASNSLVQLWALHSLLLTANAAGLSYVPKVRVRPRPHLPALSHEWGGGALPGISV